jgi:hypothetical protein
MWAQPWAWLGLAGLAVPLAIHLLARHQAIRTAFPTLKFITASELTAIKRQRLTDIPLLLLRLLIVALAVAAIAGPRLGSAAAASDEEPARATIYDTTASAASGRIDAVVDGPRPRRAIVRAESLPEGLKAATAWAIRQPGRREITVVSDFQLGSVDDAAIQRVPKGIGLHFERVPSTPRPMPDGFTRDGNRARMVWPAQRPGIAGGIVAKAGPDQAAADATLRAVESVVPVEDHSAQWPVLILCPGAPDRETLLSSMAPIDQPWMFGVTRELLAKNPPIARAGTMRPKPATPTLVVALDAAPGTTEAAQAVASIATGLSRLDSVSESDPRTIDDAQLKAWERPSEVAIVQRAGEPQGRWLWMGVVALLALETLVRRRAA